MSKTGRNDPCPCGSGKKYKKCCMNEDSGMRAASAAAGGTGERVDSSWSVRGAGLDIHPYAFVKLIENPSRQALSGLSPRDIAALKDKWTIGKVARLETDEIVDHLRTLGIDASRSAFIPLTEGHASAWRVGETWVAGFDRPPGMHDEDFTFLAACELWKRYCPERPSNEMMDDLITEGYDSVEAREDGKAVDIWLRVWDHICPRLGPQIKTFGAADPVFQISQFFGNWIQDFETALENAARKDRAYADTGIRMVREVLDRFMGEDENTVLNYRCDLGRFLFLAGRTEEGEAALLDVIREHPRRAHGYVTLSNELTSARNARQDTARAIALLEQALSYPVEDAADWDIELRLADLRASRPSTTP